MPPQIITTRLVIHRVTARPLPWLLKMAIGINTTVSDLHVSLKLTIFHNRFLKTVQLNVQKHGLTQRLSHPISQTPPSPTARSCSLSARILPQSSVVHRKPPSAAAISHESWHPPVDTAISERRDINTVRPSNRQAPSSPTSPSACRTTLSC